MSSEIGIGVRVYIKWNPRLREGKACRIGTIVSGPYAANTRQFDEVERKTFRLTQRSWAVRLDGDDSDNSYMEPDIEPIQGGVDDRKQWGWLRTPQREDA